MRILLDVNILVRANEHSQGPARVLLDLLLERHTLIVSDEMLVELARVLRYPRLQKLYGLTEQQIYEYVGFLREAGEITTPDRFLPVPMRDMKDIAVLQAAISGQVDVICTLDTDFYAANTLAFCATLNIEICTDAELIGRISVTTD